MKRHFPNFIDAWLDAVDNKFAPRIFHEWAIISGMSAAVERKVWINPNKNYKEHLNIYVFLIARPGVGKSTAINPVMSLVTAHNNGYGVNNPIKLLPQQVTEQKLIDIMSIQQSMELGSRVLLYCAGYGMFSEASDSLKEMKGSNDLIAALTQLYDCAPVWSKATKKDGETKLINVYLSLIAGCTPDFLGKLVTSESIKGGFASRLIYVVYDEPIERTIRWGDDDSADNHDIEIDERLLADFAQINQLKGKMRASTEFGNLYGKWNTKFLADIAELESENMQALQIRKPTNLLKLAGLMSVAEGNDLILLPRHWERALELLDRIEPKLPGLLRESTARNMNAPNSTMQAVFNYFVNNESRDFTFSDIVSDLALAGISTQKTEQLVQSLVKGGKIKALPGSNGENSLKLLVDPNAYL